MLCVVDESIPVMSTDINNGCHLFVWDGVQVVCVCLCIYVCICTVEPGISESLLSESLVIRTLFQILKSQ